MHMKVMVTFINTHEWNVWNDMSLFSGPSSFDILQGHSKSTMFLICNNAAQGILSSFFFKYAGKAAVACLSLWVWVSWYPVVTWNIPTELYCWYILLDALYYYIHGQWLQIRFWRSIPLPLPQFLQALHLLLCSVTLWQ